jgi:hypothetical protein
MVARTDDSRRRLSAAEAVAGAGIGLTAVSNRVPEMANAYVRRPRKQAYKEAKAQEQSGKVFHEGKWVDPKDVPERIPGEAATHIKADGTVISYKKKDQFPRRKAANAAREETLRTKAEYKNKGNVPFPENEWTYEDKPGSKPDKKTGRLPQQKKKWEVTPEGKKVRTLANKGVTRRAAVMAVGIPVGLGLAWHGARNYAQESQLKRAQERKEISKDISRRDVDAAVTGGSIGGAVYHAPSLAEWAYRSKWDKKIANNKQAQKAVEGWKKKYDLTGAQKGVKAWHDAYRHLPDEIPAAKMRRAMAYTHAGASGVALTTIPVAAGAAIGVRTSRQHQRKKAARLRRKEQRKAALSKKRDTYEEVKHKRAVQGALSIGTATLGLAALGSKGGAVALKKYPNALKSVHEAPKQVRRLKAKTLNDASLTLTTGGAGLGGMSGYHFAALQRAENKAERERESKR